MQEKLIVAAIQYDIHWEAVPSNLALLNDLFTKVNTDADLVLLPEMFATGFSMNAAEVAQTMDGRIVNWMREKARQYNLAVGGSVIIEESGNFYNRFIWVDSEGHMETYDKRHLFTLSGEDKYYTAGDQRILIEYKGWKICPQVCYDLRFPVWSRNDLHYDVLCYVANWPTYRTHAWRSLLIARAIENQSYVIGVNRIGVDNDGNPFPGNSAVVDYAGIEQVHVGSGTQIIHSELSKSAMEAFRSKFQFLNDRDAFTIDH